MSRADMEDPCTPRTKHRKHKDKTEKKKKKRKRDEFEENESSPAKSSKKSTKQHRDEQPHEDVIPEDRTEYSSLTEQNLSLYLPLSPIAQIDPLEGLCAEHLSPLLLTYYEPLNGIILAYSNAHLSNNPTKKSRNGEKICAKAIDEYAVNFAWVTADFLLLRPERGTWLRGHINVQNESYIGLVCWNMFNANIPRKRIPKEWRWHTSRPKKKQKTDANGSVNPEDARGYFVDHNGDRVDSSMTFRVIDFETVSTSRGSHGFLGIEGTLLSEEEEKESEQQELKRQKELREEREDRHRDQQQVSDQRNNARNQSFGSDF